MNSPNIVWREDAPEPNRAPPRPDPPRHAEAAAQALFERVAARPARPPRPRVRWRGIALGLGMLIVAGVTTAFEWDTPLLRLPSIIAGAFGLLTLLKGLLGYR